MVGMVTIVSTLFSMMLRTFFRPFAHKSKTKSSSTRESLGDFDAIMNIFSTLNQALVKYGIDTNACAQRMVCVFVKNAVIDRKVKKKSASHYNRIIEGLSR